MLWEDFVSEWAGGPRKASRLLYRNGAPVYVADLVGDVGLLLQQLRQR